MSGFLIDIDGTTLLGAKAITGVSAFIHGLRAQATPFCWVTNNTSRSRAGWLARLGDAGFAPEPHELYTAGDATVDWIARQDPRPRVFLVGTPALASDFRAAGIELVDERPDLLVLGYDTTLTYEKIAALGLHLAQDIPFVATHPDLTCPTPAGPIPDVGSFIAMFETATGRRPDRILGKPARTMIEGAARHLGISPTDVVMVGDRLETDIRMANAAGVESWLVLSGITTRADAEASSDRPTRILGSLAEATSD